MALRDITLGSVFIALGLAIPVLFHAVGMGSTFLPMFLPILAAGLLLPWRPAGVVGVVTPLMSSLLTGMPPMAPPIAAVMALEGAVLATLSSCLYRRLTWPIHLATITAVLAQRLAMALATLVWAPWFGLPGPLTALGSLARGLPGVVLLVIVVPVLVRSAEALDRRRYGPSQTPA